MREKEKERWSLDMYLDMQLKEKSTLKQTRQFLKHYWKLIAGDALCIRVACLVIASLSGESNPEATMAQKDQHAMQLQDAARELRFFFFS